MNKLTKKALIAIAATVFTTTAFAANWVQLTGLFEINTESILRGPNFTSFWVRRDANEPNGVASTYMFYDIRCDSRELRIRSFIKYSLPKGNGEVVSYATQERPFHPILPETHGDSFYTFICTSRK